nr:MAG TPA: hypothetical protein [Caudoviricetes sp.]
MFVGGFRVSDTTLIGLVATPNSKKRNQRHV